MHISGYEIGRSYFSSYWSEKYTVLELEKDMLGWYVVVEWEGGKITKQRTPRIEMNLGISLRLWELNN